MSEGFKSKEKQKEKLQEESQPQWKINEAYVPKEAEEKEIEGKVTVNPLFVEATKEEQKKPEGIDLPPEPVQQKKLSKKQRKKLEKQQLKESKEKVQENVATAKALAETVLKKGYSNAAENILRYADEKQYGKMAASYGNLAPLAEECNARRALLVSHYPQYKSSSEDLRRDVASFLIGPKYESKDAMGPVAEAIFKVAESSKDTPLETIQKAGAAAIPAFNNTTDYVRQQIADRGVMDLKFNSPEDVVNTSFLVADLYRLLQAPVKYAGMMGDAVPQENVILMRATMRFVMSSSADANWVMKQDEESKAKFKEKQKNGEFTFKFFLEQARNEMNPG